MSQAEFIDAMESVLGRRLRLEAGQPSEVDLTAYFASLSEHPGRALAAYQSYAEAFYVHVSSIGSGGGDVASPGDRWSSLRRLRVHGSGRQRRRVTDCEGYSFIARHLLSAAGWSFEGYRLVYRPLPPGTPAEQLEFHIVAELSHADHDSVYIGSARVSESLGREAHAVFPGGAEYRQLRGSFLSARAAIEEAQSEAESGRFIEDAPLRPRLRRGSLPPALGH